MSDKILIVGGGITGITLAERLASFGKKVLIIEKRNHIGGNCFDFENDNGILVHKYGPHIFHTDHKEVWNYLSKFTEWIDYQHKVLGFIDGKLAPIPFNLNTLHKLLPKKLSEKLEKKLVNKFGYNKRIPILTLKKNSDKDLKLLADFVYEKVFLHYTEKQWGLKPEEIDFSVTARVPVVISCDNRYFQDKYQGIPRYGYTRMFEKMLQNRNVEVKLNTDYKSIKKDIGIDREYNAIFYTGPIDEFFDFKFGKLEYRCLRVEFETFDQESYQIAAVINYPDQKHPFTRVTEFKKLTQQKHKKTTIGREFTGSEGFIAWPILNKKNKDVFQRYWQEARKLKSKRIHFIGRLAEYKYYDMDSAIKRVFDELESIKII